MDKVKCQWVPAWLRLFLLVGIAIASGGCLDHMIADQVLKGPNGGQRSIVSRMLEDGKHVGLNYSCMLNDVDVVEVGPPIARMAYYTVEPKGKFYYVMTRMSRDLDEHAVRKQTVWLDRLGEKIDEEDGQPSDRPALIEHNYEFNAPVYGGEPQILVLGHPVVSVDERVAMEKEPIGTIILLQGLGGSVRENPYLWHLAGMLSNYGYRVVMPDMRGHGDSTGDEIGFGLYEAKDISQLIDDLERKGKVAGKLGIMGHSYGAMMSIYAAAYDKRIEAVLGISPHNWLRDFSGAATNIAKLFRPKVYGLIMTIGNEKTIPSAIEIAADRLGVDPDAHGPAAVISQTDAPLLLLHGDSDQICPFSASEQILAARPENSELLIFKTDDHWTHLYRRTLWQEVLSFMDHYLPESPMDREIDADRHVGAEDNPAWVMWQASLGG